MNGRVTLWRVAASMIFRNLRLLIALLLLIPTLLVFGRALIGQEAFVPVDQLSHVGPWASRSGTGEMIKPPVPWNVLRFDGVAEFYPWRKMVAQAWQAGRIALWNPYSFGATSGVPLLANGQSAPLYPPNLLFALFPSSSLWYAFGLVSALHHVLLAGGMYLLLRSYSLGRTSALFGATMLALSAPVITWLALPTFLSVTAWVPWLLLAVRRAWQQRGTAGGRYALLGTGAIAGTMILAGHLQMALYGLLCAGLYGAFLVGAHFFQRRTNPDLPPVSPFAVVAGVAFAGFTAVCLALPQLLPAVELSRVSHRAGQTASWETYNGYVSTALPVRNFVTFLAPDFFGHPVRNEGFYWNSNNYAEWAVYIGVIPFALACAALCLGFKAGTPHRHARAFFALLGLCALALATGSPLNVPLFFLLPGYSQTGNPARVLFFAALALSGLAAVAFDALLTTNSLSLSQRKLPALGAILVPVFLGAIGASAATSWAKANVPDVAFGDLIAPAFPQLLQAGLLLAVVAVVVKMWPRVSASGQRYGGPLLAVIALLELWSWGRDYNPNGKPGEVFPVTPGIAFLQANVRPDELIAPINRSWSLSANSPQSAVLPPNLLAVYGLHDVAGYDSLFPARAKAALTEANQTDPAPPENGNMAFVKSVEAAQRAGAHWILLAPIPNQELSFLIAQSSPVDVAYSGSDLIVLKTRPVMLGEQPIVVETGKALRAFDTSVGQAYRPTSFRLGLFAGLFVVGMLGASATLPITRPKNVNNM